MKTRTQKDQTMTVTRRRFLQGGLAAAAAASIALPLSSSEAATVHPSPREAPPKPVRGKGPNILIILCDQMRFPPVYESETTKQFREDHLTFQNTLRANGLDFQRHYVMSAACVPSRASLLTGHYPSLHGATQTPAAAKEAWDRDLFWLDPNTVPTFGDYFRAAGYRTYWRGKWHVSFADILVPGTHTSLVSFDPDTGVPDANKEALYSAADRLDPYGFSGWIGPEPHGAEAIKDSGSSVPKHKRGRDVGYAEQTVKLIQELNQEDSSSPPWLVVCSFVNPHDIGMYGFWSNQDPNTEFKIDDDVPSGNPQDEDFLFDWVKFIQTFEENLKNKPTAQQSYQENYGKWLQPILVPARYYRYYYQLHKNVDGEMMKVMDALLNSRFKDDTIVVFASDHGELLGAHGYMHQKMYQAYEETIRVPLIIWSPKLFKEPRATEVLTSHADLAPTLLGLAGIDPEAMRGTLATSHSEVIPMVGRDLSPLILGQIDANSVNDPVYFMTDDDAFRGLNDSYPDGRTKPPIVQPNHIETVVARLDDGKVWKLTRYFDNPQFWSSPGTPGDDAEDVQKANPEYPYPGPDQSSDILFTVTVKATPKPEEFEMYRLTSDLDDPNRDRYAMELTNLYGDPAFSRQQQQLAMLLAEQCKHKRLVPCTGDVPGDPDCGQQRCRK